MTLEPASYECPEHHTDLTDLVEEELGVDGLPPLAYFRFGSVGKRSATSPFEVIVTCPGANGVGSHELTCAGIQSQ
jgi:hypothetical protein